MKPKQNKPKKASENRQKKNPGDLRLGDAEAIRYTRGEETMRRFADHIGRVVTGNPDFKAESYESEVESGVTVFGKRSRFDLIDNSGPQIGHGRPRGPKKATICKFINKVIVPNEERVFSLIMLQIAREVGIALSESDAFIDGTKYQANANKYKFVWKPVKRHKKLSAKISDAIKRHGLITNYNEPELIGSETVATALINLRFKEADLPRK